ncbi:hypothetical protein BT63DRAFT_425136 [Microthyrium microscopicum]|uniref:E3 ubiquitin protein ligase n=1 Tax=Microthyrium microscopicum TaxID=703497 RepID=A0A6A6UB63_9PEZI|nr:hypothetical protein BT63DRAFT_425136 [Microthyrium microscopicum]
MLNRQQTTSDQGPARESSSDGAKQSNGASTNGVSEVNGASVELLEQRKLEIMAELEKCKEQIATLEANNAKVNEQLSTATTRMLSLNDEDYAKTELFKALKAQHEDVLKRINDIEAKNVLLREEATKLASERTLYRGQVEEECRLRIEEAEAQVARVDLDIQRIRSERDQTHQQRAMLESNQTKYTLAMREVSGLNEAHEKQILALEDEVRLLRREPVEADAAIDAIAEQGVDALKSELASKRSQYDILSSEMTNMQEAITKYKQKALSKVKETVQIEEHNQKLREDKHQLESKRFNERQALEARRQECELMRKQSGKSAEIIQQLKEAENKSREYAANLEKQLAEARSQLDALTLQHRTLTSEVTSLKTLAAGHATQTESWKRAIAAKDTDLATAQAATYEAQREAAGLQSQLTDTKKKLDALKHKSPKDESEMVKNLKDFVYCSVCRSNPKNIVLKSCGHVMCSECVKDRITNRNRKCPTCLKPFSEGDKLELHMV